MINIGKELAVQSYCYRGFKDIHQFLAKVKETGLDRVELCFAHVKPSQPETFDAILKAHKDAGVQIISYGVHGMGQNEADDRAAFEFCKAAGAKQMNIDFKPETFQKALPFAEKLAEEYDLKLMIHNHGGRHWLGSAQMLEYVFSQASRRIGLGMDTAWMLHSHEDPIAMVERFGKRLYGLHLKDFTFNRDGSFQDAVVGTGCLNLTALNEALRKIDFNGVAILEFEGNVDNPVPATIECVKNIRKHMNG